MEDRRIDDVIVKTFFNSLLYKTNRFQVAVRLFSNRSQRTSKCGKNISDIYRTRGDTTRHSVLENQQCLKLFKEFADAFYMILIVLGLERVKLPKSEQEVCDAVNNFYDVHRFPQCIGAVDGTRIFIKQPLKMQLITLTGKTGVSLCNEKSFQG